MQNITNDQEINQFEVKNESPRVVLERKDMQEKEEGGLVLN